MEVKQDTGYSFKLSNFKGPLDLLLFMIRKNEINIYDIPIAQITEQYIEYISAADEMSLDDLTSFHFMAVTLLYMKSRSLLPVDVDELSDKEDPRSELVEKLIEYQKYKILTELMENKEKENDWVLDRHRLQPNLPFNDENVWRKIDIWELVKTFSEFKINIDAERIIDMYEDVTVNEKTALLMEFLDKKGECRFTELIVKSGAMEIVCAFLAVLEAAKMRMIALFQNRLYADILIRSNEWNL